MGVFLYRDALLQKTYTIDFLSKKRADNTGQIHQYYVQDSHPSIIDKEI
ncbi:Recombinase [Sporomusa ovata]|uniref:Recombinase n=1 Tax=Sporomusa ovata TaxID=2378 RepID=A0A0U1L4W0_9FIRM|nr:Recombinase [Sporomusa ovata]